MRITTIPLLANRTAMCSGELPNGPVHSREGALFAVFSPAGSTFAASTETFPSAGNRCKPIARIGINGGGLNIPNLGCANVHVRRTEAKTDK
jgi:hypothetical protein